MNSATAMLVYCLIVSLIAMKSATARLVYGLIVSVTHAINCYSRVTQTIELFSYRITHRYKIGYHKLVYGLIVSLIAMKSATTKLVYGLIVTLIAMKSATKSWSMV